MHMLPHNNFCSKGKWGKVYQKFSIVSQGVYINRDYFYVLSLFLEDNKFEKVNVHIGLNKD